MKGDSATPEPLLLAVRYQRYLQRCEYYNVQPLSDKYLLDLDIDEEDAYLEHCHLCLVCNEKPLDHEDYLSLDADDYEEYCTVCELKGVEALGYFEWRENNAVLPCLPVKYPAP